jgi:hypothetical protein
VHGPNPRLVAGGCHRCCGRAARACVSQIKDQETDAQAEDNRQQTFLADLAADDEEAEDED